MGRADVGRGGADGDFSFIEAWAEHSEHRPGDRPGAEHGSALFARRWDITAKRKLAIKRIAKLDPFKDYILEKLRAAAPDKIPAVVLFREIRQRGYRGG